MKTAKASSKQPLSVLFVTSEIAPWVKTGGLGDVAGALPQALMAAGLNVRVLVPAYPALLQAFPDAPVVARMENLGGHFAAAALRAARSSDGLELLLLDCPEYFNRNGNPYLDEQGHDRADNVMRFGLFSRVAALLAGTDSPLAGYRPDILHLNDWQSALAPAYLHFLPHGKTAATVLTVHNLAFQGNFPTGTLDALGLPAQALRFDGIEHWGYLSFLKAGLQLARQITTVSPTYAKEIQGDVLGFGLGGVLRWRSSDLTGILNGIDNQTWNPAGDPHIAKAFSKSNLAGKRICRQALRSELELAEADMPILGVVTRLTHQKGSELILSIADALMDLPVQLVLLGSGDKTLEQGFTDLARRYPDRAATVIGFNEGLAHRIEAGADIFLMPSRFEPCGLNQMYSLAYGTPPLVRATGGLADTVVDTTPQTLANNTANGFIIDHQGDTDSPAALLATIRRAVDLWHDKTIWQAIQKHGMSARFDWAERALEYKRVYERACQA